MGKVEVDIKDKRLLTIDETAALLGTSPQTVKKAMKKGLIKFLKLGSNYRIYAYELDEFCKMMEYKQFDLNTLELIDLQCKDVIS